MFCPEKSNNQTKHVSQKEKAWDSRILVVHSIVQKTAPSKLIL